MISLTAKQFIEWLDNMQVSGAEAGRLLGVHANTILRYKTEGAPLVVALACRALYHRLEPWR